MVTLLLGQGHDQGRLSGMQQVVLVAWLCQVLERVSVIKRHAYVVNQLVTCLRLPHRNAAFCMRKQTSLHLSPNIFVIRPSFKILYNTLS